jgi:FtsP/CotA-like multicopper oxidase with cupredoxin domain
MKRRDFLKLTGASVPAVSLLGCHDDGKVSNDVTLSNSYQYGVVNGPAMARVEVNENAPYTMNVERNAVAGIVQGIPLNYRTFNGKFPPDTLVAKPGDKMKITFVNNLEHSAEDYFHPSDVNIPHGFNNLNLHTHGLNVSPTGIEDNVLHVVHPGETFEHEITIPADHPSGTFWYHPHKHGSALHQMASGMCGFLMIEGGADDLNMVPEIAAAKDVELAFHELIVGIKPDNLGTVPNEGTPGVDLPHPLDYTNPITYSRNPIYALFSQQAYLQYTLNGKAVDEGVQRDSSGVPIPGTAKPPEINMAPGELQRWRFGMLCHLQTYKFKLVNANDPTNTDHIPLRVAAWDGITANEITSHEDIITGPGNRLDLLIKAPTTPGTYQLKMLYEQFGADGNGTNVNEFPIFNEDNTEILFWLPAFTTPAVGATELVILQVNIQGDVNDMPLPAALNPPSNRLPPIETVSRNRTIEFKVEGQVSINFAAQEGDAGLMDNRKFTVNSTPFNAHRINETMLLNDSEEWTITNVHTGPRQFRQINHPFHIHVNWFYLKEVHEPIKDANGDHVLDADGHPTFEIHHPNYWADTVDVPHGGKAVIRHKFENFTGIFPMHCHVIAHEDEGMMHLCEVVDGSPVSQSITASAGGSVSCHAKTSNDADAGSRLVVDFPANSLSADATVEYEFALQPVELVDVGVAVLERSFSLTSTAPLTDEGHATVTVHYAMALTRGHGYHASTVALHSWDGSAWTQDGITTHSLDESKGILVAKIDKTALANTYFSVLATESSGPTNPYVNLVINDTTNEVVVGAETGGHTGH